MEKSIGIYLKTEENFNELLKLIHRLGENHFSDKPIKPYKVFTIKQMTRTHRYGAMVNIY